MSRTKRWQDSVERSVAGEEDITGLTAAGEVGDGLSPDGLPSAGGAASAARDAGLAASIQLEPPVRPDADPAGLALRTCSNCGHVLTGPFCTNCGQKDADIRRPFWSLFAELLEAAFSLDGRASRTLTALLVMPGVMTANFMAGKRQRYIPPIRLYFLVSLLFFGPLAISDVALVDVKVTYNAEKDAKLQAEREKAQQQSEAEAVTEEERQQAIDDVLSRIPVDSMPPGVAEQVEANVREELAKSPTIGISSTDIEDLPYDFELNFFAPIEGGRREGLRQEHFEQLLEDSGGWYGEQLKDGFAEALKRPDAFNRILNDWLPRALLILVPALAILLRLTHWGKQRRLVHQLVFSLHFHSLVFLMLTAILIAVPVFGAGNASDADGNADTGLSASATWLAVWIFTSVYLIVALKYGQMQGWIRAFLKAGFIYVAYITVMTIVLSLALVEGLRDF